MKKKIKNASMKDCLMKILFKYIFLKNYTNIEIVIDIIHHLVLDELQI